MSASQLRFCLYIAEGAPNSLRAHQNLHAFCASFSPQEVLIEIVDVWKEPLRALNEKILLTPTLVVVGQNVERRIVGDLSDAVVISDALSYCRLL